MTKVLGALMMVLCLSLLGSGVANALVSSPTALSQQDGGKGQKKHKKGKKAAKKPGKKQNRKKGKKQLSAGKTKRDQAGDGPIPFF